MHLSDLIGVPLFIPSLYGDIRLTAQSTHTEVEWENLSPSERLAMDALGKRFDVDTAGSSGSVRIVKPVDKVEAVLAKAMKRGRKLLSAVVFKNGRIEEVHRTADGEAVAAPAGHPYRDLPDDPPPGALVRSDEADKKSTGVVATVKGAIAASAKAAVTVAQPTVGCPVPEFERAEVRATRVLRAFLTDGQLADFERTQTFLVSGADSGHLYLLTSRHAPLDRWNKVGGRSVYNVTLGQPVCVHDWTVPAAEELMELKLFLEISGRERYVRSLPEAFA